MTRLTKIKDDVIFSKSDDVIRFVSEFEKFPSISMYLLSFTFIKLEMDTLKCNGKDQDETLPHVENKSSNCIHRTWRILNQS